MRHVAVLILICACGRVGFYPQDAASSTPWWDAAYAARLRLSIPAGSVSEELVGFPLLITLDASLVDRMSSDASDLQVVDPETGLPLAHDLRAGPGSGQLVIWVAVPRIRVDTPTPLELYFDRPASGSLADPETVWASHIGVWHLDDAPDMPIVDATGSGGTGASVGGMGAASLTPGIGHRALDFDGVDDGIDITTGPVATVIEPFTLTFWSRPRSFAGEGNLIVARALTFGGANFDFYVRHYPRRLNGGVYNGTEATYVDSVSDPTWELDEWRHGAVVAGDGVVQLYLNGVLVEEAAYTGSIRNSGQPVRIGHWSASCDERCYDGAIDEVWFAPVRRSAAWVAALHASQADRWFEVSPVESRGKAEGAGRSAPISLHPTKMIDP